MNGIAQALAIAIDLLSGAINLQAQLAKVSEVIRQAQAEGRDVTPAELDALRAERLKARQEALDA